MADKVCHKCTKGTFFRVYWAPKIDLTKEAGSYDNEVILLTQSEIQSAVVTCTVNEWHKVVFEIDTGASPTPYHFQIVSGPLKNKVYR